MEMIEGRPNILVVGVDHAGTSVVTKLLQTLGWKTPQADQRYCEHVGVRNANTRALRTGKLPDVRELLAELNNSQPWAVKDPRFTVTLPLWQPLFKDLPTLLWINKDLAAIKKSHIRRKEIVKGKPGNRWKGSAVGYTVEEKLEKLASVVHAWPGPVVRLDYAQIAACTKLFKPR